MKLQISFIYIEARESVCACVIDTEIMRQRVTHTEGGERERETHMMQRARIRMTIMTTKTAAIRIPIPYTIVSSPVLSAGRRVSTPAFSNE